MLIKSETDFEDFEMQNLPDQNKDEFLIPFKIVYWGPGESGKTTNFLRLKEKFSRVKITPGYSIETTDGRTLWQDSVFLSFECELEDNREKVARKYRIIVQIVTCTGQERFLSTREYVIDGADGIVFVGDSDPDKIEENKRSFRELTSFINKNNIPIILQLNKRDIKNAISLKVFKKHLSLPSSNKNSDGTMVVYESVATKGENVVQVFEDMIEKMLYRYFIG